MTESIQLCPDPECIDGEIVVYNVYSSNPLEGEVQRCDICNGESTIKQDVIYNQ